MTIDQNWTMPGLEFQEEGHVYTLNGNVIPSVTTVMREEGLTNLGGVSEAVLQNRAQFGTMAHLYTAYRDLGVLDEMSVPGPMLPILEAWEKFKADYQVEILLVEKPAASRIWQFACTPDRLAIVNGSLSVVELKTTAKIDKAVRWQLAGQLLCFEENGIRPIEDRWVVRIGHEGDLQVQNIERSSLRRDKAVITAAVTLNKAKRG